MLPLPAPNACFSFHVSYVTAAETPLPQSLHRRPIENLVPGALQDSYFRDAAILLDVELVTAVALFRCPRNRSWLGRDRTFLDGAFTQKSRERVVHRLFFHVIFG